MNIKYGLISADSHGQPDHEAFTSRMSEAQWGDRIPHIVEVMERDTPVHRWMVSGKVLGGRGVCNCPAAMNDPSLNLYPQRWEEVPAKVYVPAERLKALDEDGVDAEVLFPNDPGSFFQYGDAAFELACVEVYNDVLSEWQQESERFIPLAMLPFLSGMEATVAEVERAARRGHRGVVMLAEPSIVVEGLKHLSDPYWDRLWEVCEEFDLPVHIHASGGLGQKLSVPQWEGYTPEQFHAAYTVPTAAWPAQMIPSLIFSGMTERHPRLKWVFAETGIGSIYYVRNACDHEWERRRLWEEGLHTRPSEIVQRQMYVNFWYEKAGMELRHDIGVENIMWEADYPHTASTFPLSWSFVEQTLRGVPENERQKMLCENALGVYHLQIDDS